MSNTKRKEHGFLLYTDYADLIRDLPDNQKGVLFQAIMDYARDGVVPELDSVTEVYFKFMTAQINRDKERYDEICKKRAEAGRKGGLAKNGKKGDPQQIEKDVKERKKAARKKEPPKKKYGEFVQMTQEEYEKLVVKYGDQKVKRMVEVLDNYKGANGKTYKSDYRAILNWVAERVESEFRTKKVGDYSSGNVEPSEGFKQRW